MITSRLAGPGSESDLAMCYQAAFRRALRLRRELSIVSRCNGLGGDREQLLSDLALAVTAMDSAHEALRLLIGTRIPRCHQS